MTEREELAALRRDLTAARIENARFRRLTEDLLYNLDGENMPTVDKRLTQAEEKLAHLLMGTGVAEAILAAYGIGLEEGALVFRDDGGETETLRLSPILCKIPYIYNNPVSETKGLRPLYTDSEGRILAFDG